MRRCEDEKMYSGPPLSEESFAQMLSGKKLHLPTCKNCICKAAAVSDLMGMRVVYFDESDSEAVDHADDATVNMMMLRMMGIIYADNVCWQPLFGRTPSQVLSEKPQSPDEKSQALVTATIALHAQPRRTLVARSINQKASSQSVGDCWAVPESYKIYKQGVPWCSIFCRLSTIIFPHLKAL